jgi:hypothetical protein
MSGAFRTDIAGLADVVPPSVVHLADGGRVRLRIAPDRGAMTCFAMIASSPA